MHRRQKLTLKKWRPIKVENITSYVHFFRKMLKSLPRQKGGGNLLIFNSIDINVEHFKNLLIIGETNNVLEKRKHRRITIMFVVLSD